MLKDQLILPRPDSSCGKAFYENRRMADGHRIALELWNRATGIGSRRLSIDSAPL